MWNSKTQRSTTTEGFIRGKGFRLSNTEQKTGLRSYSSHPASSHEMTRNNSNIGLAQNGNKRESETGRVEWVSIRFWGSSLSHGHITISAGRTNACQGTFATCANDLDRSSEHARAETQPESPCCSVSEGKTPQRPFTDLIWGTSSTYNIHRIIIILA